MFLGCSKGLPRLFSSSKTKLRFITKATSVLQSHNVFRTKTFFPTYGFSQSIMTTSQEKMIKENVKRAAKAINGAKAILITAGAGMGVDSGLPDFRGPEGFWKAYPPIKKLGLTLPEISTPSWFVKDPQFAWGFFGHRMQLYKNTKPHKGFDILKKWAESKPNGYFVFTSNVDGHFQKAGFPEEKVVECHGSLNYLQKIDGKGSIWNVPEDFKLIIDDSTLKAEHPLPMGPLDANIEDQQLARPNVLMFGDCYFIDERTTEQEYRMDQFVQKSIFASTDPIVVVEIGAGLAVPTVRWRGERLATTSDLAINGKNGLLIRINPRDNEIPNKHHISLPLGGLEALVKIDEEMMKL